MAFFSIALDLGTMEVAINLKYNMIMAYLGTYMDIFRPTDNSTFILDNHLWFKKPAGSGHHEGREIALT